MVEIEQVKAYMNGVGRIRRDPFVLHVGDRQIDVDELRVHYPRARLEPLVKDLAGGPTPAEAAWLMWFCCGGQYGGLDVVRMLSSPPFAQRVEALLDTGETPAVLRLGETVLRPLMEGVAALGGRRLTGMRFVVDPIVTEYGLPTGSNNVYLEVTTEGPADGRAQPADPDQGG